MPSDISQKKWFSFINFRHAIYYTKVLIKFIKYFGAEASIDVLDTSGGIFLEDVGDDSESIFTSFFKFFLLGIKYYFRQFSFDDHSLIRLDTHLLYLLTPTLQIAHQFQK